MSNYFIGDIQGCYKELLSLLEKIAFDPQKDKLWLAGDLINRGPSSLEVIEFAYQNESSINFVLGNHELHFLAVATKQRHIGPNDTFQDILQSKNLANIIEWLREKPLIINNDALNFMMVHAGIYPLSNIKITLAAANEIEDKLKSSDWLNVLAKMYGNAPIHPDTVKNDWEYTRFWLNVLTRMRYCYSDGSLDLETKVPPGNQPHELKPWYELANQLPQDRKIIFGHWASLGLFTFKNFYCLDSGCVWGKDLTALRLEDLTIIQQKNLSS
ncbi:MAG: symmetrical bis(5'-nucleosyl)-tetraphosphatase [Gammaproteobacteria bacterium]